MPTHEFEKLCIRDWMTIELERRDGDTVVPIALRQHGRKCAPANRSGFTSRHRCSGNHKQAQ